MQTPNPFSQGLSGALAPIHYFAFIMLGLAAFIFIIKKLIGQDLPNFSASRYPYLRKEYLLSPAERSFFEVLRQVLKDTNHHIFCKVRLLDIFEIGSKEKNRWIFKNKIQAKHIDFLVCDDLNIQPLLAIELDDSSHALKRRISRDNFVDNVFAQAGLPLLRIQAAYSYNVQALSSKIKMLLEGAGIESAPPIKPAKKRQIVFRPSDE